MAHVTLACGMCFVVFVPRSGAARAVLRLAVFAHRRQERHVTRRLSLAGQLLALQVVIIFFVLVGVTAVTVAQSTRACPRVRGAAGAGGRGDAGQLARPPRAHRPTAGSTTPGSRPRPPAANSGFGVGRGRRAPTASSLASADPGELDRPLRPRRQHGAERGRLVGERDVNGRPRRGGDGAGPGRSAAGDRRVRRGHPFLPLALDELAAAAPEPADLPGTGQRPRHRGSLLRRPPGEAADARAGAAPRSPVWWSTATRCCTASARAWSAWTCAGGSP